MSATDDHANTLKSAATLARGRREGGVMPDNDAKGEAWGFARNAQAQTRDLDHLTEDALRRVTRLSSPSGVLLDLLLDGYGERDMLATTGFAPPQLDEALAALLAELDAGSTTDAIRIAIYADYRRSKDKSVSPD